MYLTTEIRTSNERRVLAETKKSHDSVWLTRLRRVIGTGMVCHIHLFLCKQFTFH